MFNSALFHKEKGSQLLILSSFGPFIWLIRIGYLKWVTHWVEKPSARRFYEIETMEGV